MGLGNPAPSTVDALAQRFEHINRWPAIHPHAVAPQPAVSMASSKRRLTSPSLVQQQQPFELKVNSRPTLHDAWHIVFGQIMQDRAAAFFVALVVHQAPWACGTARRGGGSGSRRALPSTVIDRQRHVQRGRIDLARRCTRTRAGLRYALGFRAAGKFRQRDRTFAYGSPGRVRFRGLGRGVSSLIHSAYPCFFHALRKGGRLRA